MFPPPVKLGLFVIMLGKRESNPPIPVPSHSCSPDTNRIRPWQNITSFWRVGNWYKFLPVMWSCGRSRGRSDWKHGMWCCEHQWYYGCLGVLLKTYDVLRFHGVLMDGTDNINFLFQIKERKCKDSVRKIK